MVSVVAEAAVEDGVRAKGSEVVGLETGKAKEEGGVKNDGVGAGVTLGVAAGSVDSEAVAVAVGRAKTEAGVEVEVEVVAAAETDPICENNEGAVSVVASLGAERSETDPPNLANNEGEPTALIPSSP